VRKVNFLSFSFWQVAIKATLFVFENKKSRIFGRKVLGEEKNRNINDECNEYLLSKMVPKGKEDLQIVNFKRIKNIPIHYGTIFC